MKQTILSFALCAITILSCSKPATEVAQPLDTTFSVSAESAEDAVEIAGEDTIDFNDEDYGDPGFEGLRVDEENLAPEVKIFLSDFHEYSADKILDDDGFMMMDPGPGIYPIYSFGSGTEDLKRIPEIKSLLSDSSLIENLSIYNWSGSKCDINEGMPDGIYYREVDFDEMKFDYETETLQETVENISAIRSRVAGKTGNEFIFKFTLGTGESSTIDVYVYPVSGKLCLIIIDKSDCGA